MAVRTPFVGIKNYRLADAHAAQPSQHTSKGKKTLFREEAAQLRRDSLLARARLGPAAQWHGPKSSQRWFVTVQGRKKPPSQMHLKREGG